MSNESAAPAAPVQEQSNAPVEENKQEQAPQEQVVPQKKKFVYKADGKEFSEELDDNEIQSRLSMARAAQKRMSEAASLKKQTEQLIKALNEDPMSVLTNDQIMGTKKFREIAEQFLLKQIEEESLTPEEREAADKNRRLQEYERREKEWQERQEAEKIAQLEKQYSAQYEKTIIDALQNNNLPKTPQTVKRMASLMQKNLEFGMDLDANTLASMVKEDFHSELNNTIKDASAEQLISMFGEDMVNKIRAHDLAKFRANKSQPQQNQQPSQPKQQMPKMSPREYDEYLRNKFKK